MSSSSNNPRIREIPGFYYDEEKKKYFRITKDHPKKVVSSSATANRSKDKKRQCLQGVAKTKAEKKDVPLFKILTRKEVKPLKTTYMERLYWTEKLKSLDISHQCRSKKLDLTATCLEGKVDISKMLTNKTVDKLATVSKIKGSDQSIVQVYGLNSKTRRNLTLDSPFDVLIAHCTSMSMASVEEGRDQLLISTISNSRGSEALIESIFLGRCLTRERVRRIRKTQFVWASCFITNSFSDKRFALATTGGVLVVEPSGTRDHHTFLNTTKSDVLAVEYSTQSRCLYTGSRDRTVHSFDLRRPKFIAAARAKQSVDYMKHLDNEFHLIISTLAGHIELWDTRSWRPVLSYPGHQNSHSMLQVHVDPNENFLASVGEDCVTRIWELRTSNLIKCIPSFRFYFNNDNVMPAISFIGDKSSNRTNGLLYGIQDEIYFYTL